jgi:hypothetical protein
VGLLNAISQHNAHTVHEQLRMLTCMCFTQDVIDSRWALRGAYSYKAFHVAEHLAGVTSLLRGQPNDQLCVMKPYKVLMSEEKIFVL